MSHLYKKIRVIPLVISVLLAIFSGFFLSQSLTKTTSVSVSLALDHEDFVILFYTGKSRHSHFSEGKTTVGQQTMPGKRTIRLHAKRGGVPMATIRLDPGSYPGIVKLYKIVMHRPLAEDIKLGPVELNSTFKPGKESVQIRLADDHLEIVSLEEDPFIISGHLEDTTQWPGLILIPLLIGSVFFYLILCRISDTQLANCFNIARVLPTSHSYIKPFDGLRAIAAMMVIADHTWGRFQGLGTSGVWIFFSLSGFLLARPLINNPSKMTSASHLFRYGEKRLCRIMPMYCLYILLIYVISLRLGDAVLHLFFIKADGHLWAVQQEMLFYLLFPLLPLAFHRILSNNPLLIAGLLTLTITLLNIDAIPPILLHEMGRQMPFYLEIFLGGVLVCYIHSYLDSRFHHVLRKPWLQNCFTLIALLILLGFWLFSNGKLYGSSIILSQHCNDWFGLGAALLVFSVLASEDSLMGRFLSLPLLRSFGIISYSIYLLHPILINIIMHLDEFYLGWGLYGPSKFIITVIVSYFIACLTYRYVEVPFLQNVEISASVKAKSTNNSNRELLSTVRQD